MASTASKNSPTDFSLEEVVNELLMVLSDKERAVITKRFSLDNKPRQTLESIGKNFSVTRERIRQIEATALKKLQRNAANSRIKSVGHTIVNILDDHGGICEEKQIITEALSQLYGHSSPVNGQIIRLALSITPNIMRSDSPKSFHRFWYDKRITSMPEVKKIAKAAYQITKKTRRCNRHRRPRRKSSKKQQARSRCIRTDSFDHRIGYAL
jgi:hypothetical protein